MLTIKKTKKNHKASLKVGVYDSICTSIRFHEEYADGEALKVEYILTDENEKKFEFSEVFFNNGYNSRSAAFFDYLEANGIDLDDVSVFIGCTERVTLKKLVRSNRPMLSIVAREFVAHAAGDDSAI